MSEAEQMILEDAISTAIKAEKKLLVMKIAVAILSVALITVSAYAFLM